MSWPTTEIIVVNYTYGSDHLTKFNQSMTLTNISLKLSLEVDLVGRDKGGDMLNISPVVQAAPQGQGMSESSTTRPPSPLLYSQSAFVTNVNKSIVDGQHQTAPTNMIFNRF